MGHHGRAKNADADVKHFLICDDAWIGNKPQEDAGRAGLGKDQFSGKTTSDGGDKSDHNSLDIAKAFCLQIQHQEHIGRSNDATPHQRNSEEKLQPDGRADNLRQIASSDGELAKNPEKPDGRCRVVIATGLGKVAARGHPEFDAQMLEQDGHQIGDHDDSQKRVTKPGPSSQIGGPVARIHVADRHEEPRAGESRQFAPK